MPEVIRGPMRRREALLTAAYLMYRAEIDHIYLKGSDADVFFVVARKGLSVTAGGNGCCGSDWPRGRFHVAVLLYGDARCPAGGQPARSHEVLQENILRKTGAHRVSYVS